MAGTGSGRVFFSTCALPETSWCDCAGAMARCVRTLPGTAAKVCGLKMEKKFCCDCAGFSPKAVELPRPLLGLGRLSKRGVEGKELKAVKVAGLAKPVFWKRPGCAREGEGCEGTAGWAWNWGGMAGTWKLKKELDCEPGSWKTELLTAWNPVEAGGVRWGCWGREGAWGTASTVGKLAKDPKLVWNCCCWVGGGGLVVGGGAGRLVVGGAVGG